MMPIGGSRIGRGIQRGIGWTRSPCSCQLIPDIGHGGKDQWGPDELPFDVEVGVSGHAGCWVKQQWRYSFS